MSWDDDKKAKAISLYQEFEPTAANSMEIVKEVADQLGESVNGVRMILSKAGVYIVKEKASGSSAKTGEAKASGGTRVSKESAHAALTAAIEAAGQSADSEIISKLTGKAAVYLAELIGNIAAK